MSSYLQLQLRLPLLRRRPIQCASDRQALFNRIAPVYDTVRLLLLSFSFFLHSFLFPFPLFNFSFPFSFRFS